MNIKDGLVYCHICMEDIEIGDLIKKGDERLCSICGERLGYVWDLEEAKGGEKSG